MLALVRLVQYPRYAFNLTQMEICMKKSLLVAVIALVAVMVVAPTAANADTLTFNFTSDHCTNGCTPAGASNMGTITVTDVSSGVVNVSVSLLSGFGFVSTGAGGTGSFFFRLTGAPTITYSNVTTGWSIPDVIPVNQQAPGSYAGDGLSGQFEYELACNPPGAPTGCGNGGSSPFFGTLSFTVTASGITASSFNNPGTSGSPFAADVISTTGNTGLIDASLNSQITLAPEPASLGLLAAGLLSLGGLVRRRK